MHLWQILDINLKNTRQRQTNFQKCQIAGKNLDGAYLAEIRFEEKADKSINVIHALIRGPNAPSSFDVEKLETKLPLPRKKFRNELRIRFVKITVINRDGALYQDTSPYESE